MPHKRNPVLTENLTGLARLVRMASIPAMENVALWHERDISHSSVERGIGPDATVTLDFALVRLTNVIENLVGEGNFLDLLKADDDVSTRLSGEELEELFDLTYHTKHVDTIFKRVFEG